MRSTASNPAIQLSHWITASKSRTTLRRRARNCWQRRLTEGPFGPKWKWIEFHEFLLAKTCR